MRILLAIVTLISLPAFAQHSEFKGWAAIKRELTARLAPQRAELELDDFIPAEGLEALMGTWVNYGAEHSFRNGTPNPVNMLLWHVTLSGFSKSMGQSCARDRFGFHPQFKQVLSRVCEWPKADAQSDAAMVDFFLSVMGYNAPESEYVLWRDFFRQSGYKSKPAAEVVEAMTLAITMNPYFQLTK